MTTEAERDDESRWEELVLAESCGEITDLELMELERLAEQSETRSNELQVLSAIGSLVPLSRELPTKDRQLIHSLLTQYRKRANRSRATARAIGLALTFLPLAAAAAYWVDKSGGLVSAPVTPSPGAGAVESRTGKASPPSRPASRETDSRRESSLRAPAPAASLVPISATPPSAAELLSRAQDARSVRNYAGAIKLYRDLARNYPKSAEAHLSRISLAQLELTQQNPAQALAGFEAYERLGGPLLQEAEYGKIQALGALGRTEEERAEIRRFLARHPKSLQAAALKRRLGAEGATE